MEEGGKFGRWKERGKWEQGKVREPRKLNDGRKKEEMVVLGWLVDGNNKTRMGKTC